MMKAEEEKTRFLLNSFPEYDANKPDLTHLYTQIADIFVECLQDFEKKVKPTEPIGICSVKKKSTYSYSMFEGFVYFLI